MFERTSWPHIKPWTFTVLHLLILKLLEYNQCFKRCAWVYFSQLIHYRHLPHIPPECERITTILWSAFEELCSEWPWDSIKPGDGQAQLWIPLWSHSQGCSTDNPFKNVLWLCFAKCHVTASSLMAFWLAWMEASQWLIRLHVQDPFKRKMA